jgi:O-antigen/teichoic acid export membrane protein
MNKSLLSIVTRIIAIVSKFLLITFLVKMLKLDEYGTFQLINYFMLVSIYIYGLEYYMYNNREVLKKDKYNQSLNNHISIFITFLPLTVFLQAFGLYLLLPDKIATTSMILLILFINFSEYFSQEVYRYLVVLEKIAHANSLLIIKSLSFLILILIYFWIEDKIDLITTLLIMFVSYLILLVLSSYEFFSQIINFQNIKINLFSIEKIKSTFNILKPFILLMIFMKGIEFFDKFLVNYLYGSEILGIYSFLFSIAMLVHIFIVSGVYIIYLPKLIQLYEQKNKLFKTEFKIFSILTILSTLLISFCILIFVHPLLLMLDKLELENNVDLLYILLIAFNLLNVSLIPNMLLYIGNQEKDLMKITAILLLVNILLNLFFTQLFNIYGIAIALVCTYFVSIVLKYIKGKQLWTQKIKKF